MQPGRAHRAIGALRKYKRPLIAAVIWFVLFAGIECVLTLLGLGKPFERSPDFHSGAMKLMQPDPYSGLRMKPLARFGDYQLNSLGFRDDERVATEHAKLNVLCLGDSTTFG